MSNRPSSVKRITRAEILAGRNAVEHVYIDVLEAEVPIRRLTARQKAHVEATKTRGIAIKVIDPGKLNDLDGTSDIEAMGQMDGMDVSLDLEVLTVAEQEARALAVHYGLALDEPVSLADVDEIDPLAVEQIARAIYRISHVKENDRQSLAVFRGE